MFHASKEGFKIPSVERHRLEGFMQAGVFMGFASNSELALLMDNTHCDIFGLSMAERKADTSGRWKDEVMDYDVYERPAYERR